MAEASIKIKADVLSAQEQFDKLGASSDQLGQKTKAALEKFDGTYIDGFIDKQKLAEAAMLASRGESAALGQSIKAYQKEIERLVNSGLAPQSEQTRRLIAELDGLAREQELSAVTSREAAEAAKEAAAADRARADAAQEAAGRIADAAVKTLDAKTQEERGLVLLRAERDELKGRIRDLIKGGYDPESERVKTLAEEYRDLGEKIEAQEKSRGRLEGAAKAAALSLAAVASAAAAAAGGSLKAASATEDMIAQFTPLAGSAEEAAGMVRRLNKEAVSTPFELEKIAGAVKSLAPAFQGDGEAAIEAFRMLGDTAQGNAQKLNSITSAYTKAMLKGKASMEELNMMADAGVPIYSELAASMGVSVERMMEMSKEGKITRDNLTDAFKKMTGEGGIFFNGMKISSQTFSALALGVKESLDLLAGTVGGAFLPAAKDALAGVTDSINAFTEWAGEAGNLENALRAIVSAAASAAAGVAAFVAVSKGAAIMGAMADAAHKLGAAFKALGAAMSGPAGAAALAAAALAAGVSALIAAQEKQKNQGRDIAARLSEQKAKTDELLSAYSKLNPEKKIDEETTRALIGLYPDLAGEIDANSTSVEELRKKLKGLGEQKAIDAAAPFIEEMRKKYDAYLKALADVERAEEHRESASRRGIVQTAGSIPAASGVIEAFERTRDNADAILAAIGKKVDISGNFAFIDTEAAALEKTLADAEKFAEAAARSLSQRLGDIAKSEAQAEGERIDAIKRHLAQRADLEGASGEERVKAYQRELEKILAAETLTDEERAAARMAAEQAAAEHREKMRSEKAAADKKEAASLEDRLREECNMESEAQERLRERFVQFANSRMEAEKVAGDARVKWLEEEGARILGVESLSREERLAAERAFNDMLMDEEEAVTERTREEAEKRKEAVIDAIKSGVDALSAWTDIALESHQNNLDELVAAARKRADDELAIARETVEAKDELASKEKEINSGLDAEIAGLQSEAQKRAKAAAIANKALAHMEAGVNTYLAASAALASWGGMPTALGPVLATIGLGLAQQAQIAAAPLNLPSAETGGRFIIPDTGRVDDCAMLFNGGEKVDVTPRGHAGGGGRPQRISLMIDRRPLFDVINDGIRDGDIIISASNY
jgi:tape measure domain-containing protein